MIETGTLLQQRYRIDRQIGQGGMGAVYIANDERFNSRVAIKETLCFSDENFRKAIEREARLLNSLKHSSLPRVSDHFEEQNGQFLVMEYIPGEDVAAMLESSGKAFPVDQVLRWADQLLDALDYLHNQEMPVVHRDIKPQNLKINARGEIILLDFGLAKGNPTDAGHLTAAKSIFGYSRNYASLEQIQGTGTDPRSDLYSLAATLYHMLTGHAPEDALTRAMSVLSKKGDPLVPASTVNPAVPHGIAGVLQKALDLDAGERPATAAEMRGMLRNSDDYAYLADSVTVAACMTDAQILAEPTKLMAHRTHAVPGSATGVATEIIGQTSAPLSLLTSVRTEGSSSTSSDPADNGGRRNRTALFAGALSVILVGGAIGGAVYVADPSIFGYSEVQASEPTADSNIDSPRYEDASTSSIELDRSAEVVTDAPAVVSDEATLPSQPARPTETAKNRKNSARDRNSPKDEQGSVLDIQVDDPDIPAGGVVIAEKDEKGKVDMVRVNPKDPRIPNGQQFEIRGFNPFPPGFDFRNLTPDQRRKIQQLYLEKQRTHVRPSPPPQPKAKASP